MTIFWHQRSEGVGRLAARYSIWSRWTVSVALLAGALAAGSAGFGQEANVVEADSAGIAAGEASVDVIVQLRRGEAYLKAGETEKGEALLVEVRRELASLAASHPESARVRYALGLCSLFLGQMDEAEGAFRAALERDPGFELASLGLAKVYAREESYYRAASALRTALERSPESEPLRKSLAEVLVLNGKLEEAAAQYEALRQAFPQSTEYAKRLLSLHLRAGNAEDATALLDALVEAGGVSEVDRHLLLTELHLDTGSLREVPRLLQRVRRAEPEHPMLAGYFGRYYRLLGDASAEAGDWSRAVLYFNRALDYAPDQPAIQQALGSAYLEMGDFEAANERFMSLLETTPSDPQYYIDFARTQMGLGKATFAFQVIDEAYRASEGRGNHAAMKRFEAARLALAKEARRQLEAARTAEKADLPVSE